MERGSIELDAETRALLARVWRDRGRPTLVLERAAVADVERVVRAKVPPVVLAILVAEARLPAAIPDMTEQVTGYFSATFGRDWKDQADFDHVMFAQLPSDESEPMYVGFRRKSGALSIWNMRKPQAGGERTTLSDYLERRWSEDGSVRLGVKASARDVAAFAPVIDDPPPPAVRRVKHPKFGIGVVLERKDGKLRVEFDGVGQKLLGEAFVTDIE